MKLLVIDWSGIGVYIGAATLLVGVLSWWIAKLLDDKKKITEHDIKIEDLEDEMKEMKTELRYIKEILRAAKI